MFHAIWGLADPYLEIWGPVVLIYCIIGIYLRARPKELAPIRVRPAGPQYAAALAFQYVLATSDASFGFPSGDFVGSPEALHEGLFVADESLFWKTSVVTVIKVLFAVPIALSALVGEMFDSGCLGATIGGCIGLVLTILLLPFLVPIAVAELLLRFLLRSRITVRAEPAPGDAQAVDIHLTLRGLSAIRVGRSLAAAFASPILPPRIGQMAGIAAPAPGPGGSSREERDTGEPDV